MLNMVVSHPYLISPEASSKMIPSFPKEMVGDVKHSCETTIFNIKSLTI